jgi:hypothetical protein
MFGNLIRVCFHDVIFRISWLLLSMFRYGPIEDDVGFPPKFCWYDPTIPISTMLCSSDKFSSLIWWIIQHCSHINKLQLKHFPFTPFPAWQFCQIIATSWNDPHAAILVSISSTNSYKTRRTYHGSSVTYMFDLLSHF